MLPILPALASLLPGFAQPEYQSYLAHIAAADAAIRLNEPGEARRWLDAAPAEHRDWEWRYLRAACDESLAVVTTEPSSVTCVAISPDGKRAALATGSPANAVRLLDLATGRDLARLEGHTSAVYRVAFSPDGRRLVSASHDRTARVWDLDTRATITTFSEHKFPVTAAVFLPDGAVASCSYFSSKEVPIEGRVHIWDATSGEIRRTLVGGVKPQTSLVVTGDGRHILAGSWGSAIHHWDLDSTEPTPRYFGPPPSPSESLHFDDIALSPDGRLVAGACNDDAIRIHRLGSGELVATLHAHAGDATAVAFSPDGRRLASGGVDDVVRIWSVGSNDPAEFREVAVLRGHAAGIRSIAWLPDGSEILTSASDRTVRRWSTDFARYGPMRLRHPKSAYHTPTSPDGSLLAAAGDDGRVSVWNARTGELDANFEAHPGGQICTARFSPDSRRLVTCSWDKTVRVFDLSMHEEQLKIDLPAGVARAEFSPDGTLIAAALTNKTARILNATTGETLHELSGHESRLHVASFSPDGARLVTTAGDGAPRLWNPASGELLHKLKGHHANVLAAAFTPDGRQLATGGDDGSVRLWSVETGEMLRVVCEADETIHALSFNSTGSRLAVATSVTVIADPARGGAILKLPSPEDKVWHLEFSPDGTRLVTSSWTGAICVFDTDPLAERRPPLQP